MKNQMGGVVRVGRHLFGHSDGRGWVCQDFWTGDLLWQERSKLPGQGSVTYADGRLYLVSEAGTAVLLEANPAGWRERGRFELPQASRLRKARPTCALARVWTPPVVANGRLYLRDQEYLFCFDVADRSTPAAAGR
jgi:hypothetical protein